MTDAGSINALLTKSSIGPSNFNNLKSDQIVIQYKNTIGSQFNCEGVKVLPNQFVVQRYFLKEERQGQLLVNIDHFHCVAKRRYIQVILLRV